MWVSIGVQSAVQYLGGLHWDCIWIILSWKLCPILIVLYVRVARRLSYSNFVLTMYQINYWYEENWTMKRYTLLTYIVILLFRSIPWGEEKERPKEGGMTSYILFLISYWIHGTMLKSSGFLSVYLQVYVIAASECREQGFCQPTKEFW